MTQNPYSPPTAHVDDAAPQGFSWWAVWVAATCATGSAYLVGSWAGPLFQHSFFSRGQTLDILFQTLVGSWQFGVFILLVGTWSSALGGYVAAAMAPSKPQLHAFVAALLCMVSGAILYLGVFPSPYPIWVQVLGFLLVAPSMSVGAHWFARRATKV